MKKVIIAISLCICFIRSNAQSDEAQQLLLNVEKLAQFKKILKNMKDAYTIIFKGYTAVKDLSQGNFTLHKTFLDGLMEVSPAVKKYKRITDIFNYQVRILKEYKAAWQQFRDDKQFTLTEIDYLGKVYTNLFNETLKSLEELAMVITSGKLRMSDDERLQAIDRIYTNVVDQYSFLNEFNNNTAILSLQRKSEQAEIKMSRIINGIKQ
ncbi:MAG: TerB family tellurite resistance protein [Chitinophagaceae bacterium]|nr:TerB family tellurite resistance protein [Chitinophagaceae bacterium]